jgi:hypothetical protein
MSTNLEIGTTDYGNLIAGDGPLVTQSDTLAAGAEHVAGEVLGRIKLAVDTPVAGENTGDGAVTGFALGNGAKVGNYTLTCLSAAPELAVEAVTPGTNAGDGTIAAEDVDVAASAQVGDYVFTCTSVPVTKSATVVDETGNAGDGTINPAGITVGDDAITGDYVLTCLSAASSLVAGTPVPSATAVMGSITLGPKAQEGDYVLTCTNADASPTWQVRSPAGGILPSCTNGVPYVNPQVNFTISEAASPGDTITLPVTRGYTGGGVFQVVDPNGDRLGDATAGAEYEGGGLTLTVTAGSTSFEPGDTITVTVASANAAGGTFQVVDPNGDLLAPATVAVEYVGGGLTVTIPDGDTTPYAIGDSFTVTVASTTEGSGAWSVTDPDGIALRNATLGQAYAGPIAFTVNEGDTTFAPGDTWTLPVAAGSDLLKMVDKAAKDGSQNPVGILAADADASEGTTNCVIYRSGKFNSTKLIFATGTDYDDMKDALAELGIYARASL